MSKNLPRGQLAGRDTYPGPAEHKAAGLTFELMFFVHYIRFIGVVICR